MKIEIIANDDGDVMVVLPDGEVQYFYAEYSVPEEITSLLKETLPKYKD